MKKFSSLFIAILIWTVFTSAQTLRLPRDPDKLISRAQAYWDYMVSGQKAKALDLVVPEKREAFLAASLAPVLDARVESLNLTANLLHASVRIQEHTLQSGSLGGDAQSFTQNWIWRANKPKVAGGPVTGTWYLDVAEHSGPPIMSGGNKADDAEIQKDIDQHLTLPQSILNIGTVVKGIPNISINVPIVYSGAEKPLAVELATPYPGFSVSAERGGLTPESKHFTVFFDSSDWESAALAVPLHIRFAYQGAFVERAITVQGTVFAPISFRQVPPDGPAKPDDPFSVFIRNNTSDPISMQSISTEGRMLLLKSVMSLEPNQESEFVLKLIPGETNNILYLFPKKPVYGIGQFSYRARIGR